jgi:hypothetical protein
LNRPTALKQSFHLGLHHFLMERYKGELQNEIFTGVPKG